MWTTQESSIVCTLRGWRPALSSRAWRSSASLLTEESTISCGISELLLLVLTLEPLLLISDSFFSAAKSMFNFETLTPFSLCVSQMAPETKRPCPKHPNTAYLTKRCAFLLLLYGYKEIIIKKKNCKIFPLKIVKFCSINFQSLIN